MPAQPKIVATTEFKIEKGVPVPNTAKGGGRVPHYPFAAMGVGDSFFVAGKTAATFSGTVAGWALRHNVKFMCRTVDGGVRVWRTA